MTNPTSGEENIETNFQKKMTYGEYLNLDTILSSQNRLSGHHDEMLFIIIHQVSELWMKLILHELHAAKHAIETGDLSVSFKKLARVSEIQNQIIQAWDVLSTLTPAEYLEFREALGSSSGFQSYQYRLIEFALGYKTDFILKIYEKDPELLKQLEAGYYSGSIYDASIHALSRAGFHISEEVLNRDVTRAYEFDKTVEGAWIEVYQNSNEYWDLYELGEKLVDIEDCFQQWRFRHMKTVERVIGFKSGTGGSSGVGYLQKVLEQQFFPELWNLRTKL
ncbi:tryptophan 2,3-dioxygenase [Marinococcus halophilus]|uniref:Tryptophan 2,3-dioxygenase n=1 Tax=Marinococcus halophilus TaxID=1371 RepID=A0A510Y9I4_MARHA|nr:tryptophan 2,3-dioxygenase [Marinococcus halophilus]OZT79164.1 tryptophan 2,3-dioxygenase [Marinococcus halophilus]GEK59823.1 tryptophan 2,3-dioxygenase [Marinococcus halophilus]